MRFTVDQGLNRIIKLDALAILFVAEQEMGVWRVSERLLSPFQERAKVGVAQTAAEADQEHGPRRKDFFKYCLRMRITLDSGVRTMAQNNRLGVVPVSVEMDDAFRVPSQNGLDYVPLGPVDRGLTRDRFEQAIVVGSGDREPERVDGFEDRVIDDLSSPTDDCNHLM